MQVKVRRFAACALVALLVPAAAVAASGNEIDGPTTVGGHGFFGGELQMEQSEGQRPVRIVGKIGYVGFLDLAGDLKVRCAGRGRMATKDTEQGRVFLCKGRGGQAVVSGSHFKLRGFAKRFRIHVPEGASGTLNGVRAGGEDGQSRGEDGQSRGEERKAKLEERKDERDARKGKKEDEEKGEESDSNPTLAEVAAALAEATG